MQSQQLLAEGQIFEHEIFSGTERTDKPSHKVPERNEYGRNHGLNLIGTPASGSFQLILSASARGFDEGQALSYAPSGPNKIIRSKGLEHPFLTVGSKKKPITLIPDYLLTVDGNFTFVLDAKAPYEEIKIGQNVEHVYSYAIHPEIRVDLFALCNGREFILFDVRQKEPIL